MIIARMDALSINNDYYKLSAQKLTRFSYIERILSLDDKGEKLVQYYENTVIRSLSN
jgi:hypothetical protein